MRGQGPNWKDQHGHIYFHPVDGRLVFVTALVLAALVLIGWRLIAEKCKKCDG